MDHVFQDVSRTFSGFDTQITDRVFLFSNAFPWYQLHGSIGTNFWDPQGSALIGPAKL